MSNTERRKGQRGELLWAARYRDHGFEARRGQQYAGTEDSPDVVVKDLPVHNEVKTRERASLTNLYDWLAQCAREAGWKAPLLALKRNRSNFLVVMDSDDWMEQCQFTDWEAWAEYRQKKAVRV